MTDAASALPELSPGTRYGRYRIRRQLAAGGMATVYVAQLDGAAGFGKLVALKRIHPHLAHEIEFVRMFLDEARLTSRISHANVCSVTDFGEQDGTFFLAMELLHGESFSAVLRACARAKIAAVERARLFIKLVADACEGLHAAHELKDDQGLAMEVVHRDVSPQNLFVTQDGSAKVLDFGIAKARHRLQDETVGQIKGKFAYMSPEQVRGHRVDRRTDVWALGVVTWEMLAAKRLFRRETEMETMFAVSSGEIPAPSSVAPELTAEIDRVVLRAIAREPDERFATARDFGRELLRALGTLASPLGQHEVAERMAELFPDADTKRMRIESTPPPTDAPVVVPTADPLAETRPAAPLRRSRERSGSGSFLGGLVLVAVGAAGTAAYVAAPWDAPAAPSVLAPSAASGPDASTQSPDASAPPDAAVLVDASSDPVPDAPRTGRPRSPAILRESAPDASAPAVAEPPPHVPTVEGMGSLRLRARVRVDELRVDGVARNPIATHRLPAGEHEVTVVPADGVARTRQVVVEPDGRLQLDVPWW